MSWACFIYWDFTVPSFCAGLLVMLKKWVHQCLNSVSQSTPSLHGLFTVMIECINRCFSLCLSTGTSSQRRHRICRGRATSGDVLWKAQHACQHSDRPLGTGPIRNQELCRNQRGCAAVLPGGELLCSSASMTWRKTLVRKGHRQSGLQWYNKFKSE